MDTPRSLTDAEIEEWAAALLHDAEDSRTAIQAQMATLTKVSRLRVWEEAVFLAWRGHNSTAARTFLEALEVEFPDASINIPRRLRLSSLGRAAQLTGDLAAALQYHRQRLDKEWEPLPPENRRAIANALHHLADTHLQREEKDSAYPLLRLSAGLYRMENHYQDDDTRIHLLNDIACIDQYKGRTQEAIAGYQEVITLATSRNEETEIAATLNNLMHCYNALGSVAEAREYGEKAIALYRKSGQTVAIPELLSLLCSGTHKDNDTASARIYQEQLQELQHEPYDNPTRGAACYYRGVTVAENNLNQRREMLSQEVLSCMVACLQFDETSPTIRTEAERLIGDTCCREGQFRVGEQHYRRSLQMKLQEENPDKGAVSWLVYCLASTACHQKQFERAVRLLGIQHTLLRKAKRPINYPVPEEARLQRALGVIRFSQLRDEGKAMTQEAALAYALQEENKVPSGPRFHRWWRKRELQDAKRG